MSDLYACDQHPASAAGPFRIDTTAICSGRQPKLLEANPGLASRASDGRELGPRIALYSHDTMGVGHVRRNLLLAQAILGEFPRANILIIAGAREAARFEAASGIDFLTLPALHKQRNGCYDSRDLRIPLDDIVSIRGRTAEAALLGFQPDLFIVDKVPRGAEGELESVLKKLSRGGHTRLVLGLRDVLDEPEAVAADWRRDRALDFIESIYHEIWVYGDAKICDPILEYALPRSIAERVRFTGYFNQRERLRLASAEARRDIDALLSANEKFAICLLGGGQDGGELARAFLQADFPDALRGVLVAGPFMPKLVRDDLKALARARPEIRILDFVPEADLLVARAERVVAMGGYNTVSSVLSFGKPALIVPRVSPRLEQFIRAKRMEQLGLLDVLHPHALSPKSIAGWLARPHFVPLSAHTLLDMAGLDRIPRLVESVLQPQTRSAPPDRLSRRANGARGEHSHPGREPR